jgi:hypothetical protein
VSEIADFLTAQYDRIEERARAATGGPWTVDNESHAEAIRSVDGTDVIAGGRWGDEAPVFDSTEDALHIAIHDPEYVLADIASKRRIVFLAERVPALTARHNPFDNDRDAWAEVLKRLAAPFSAEPGYKHEWTV